VLREVLCESAIRMGVRSVPQEMAGITTRTLKSGSQSD
jgi:hypothetical protein